MNIICSAHTVEVKGTTITTEKVIICDENCDGKVQFVTENCDRGSSQFSFCDGIPSQCFKKPKKSEVFEAFQLT